MKQKKRDSPIIDTKIISNKLPLAVKYMAIAPITNVVKVFFAKSKNNFPSSSLLNFSFSFSSFNVIA